MLEALEQHLPHPVANDARRKTVQRHDARNRTGRHILRLHVAWKGYPDASDLYRRFMVSATYGNTTYWSNLNGRWLDDATALWVNDSNLTQRVLEIPINVIEIAPIDIRMYFSWFSNAVFLYVDPAIEFVPESDGE